MDQRSIKSPNALGFFDSYIYQKCNDMNILWWQIGSINRILVVFYSMFLMMQTLTSILLMANIHPDSKVHGANMGPIWGRQDPSGPHVGPMNLAIWEFNGMGGIQCTTPASDADFVGITKCVLTPAKASMICNYATVLIKPQHPRIALSKLTIEGPREHYVVMTVAEGLLSVCLMKDAWQLLCRT